MSVASYCPRAGMGGWRPEDNEAKDTPKRGGSTQGKLSPRKVMPIVIWWLSFSFNNVSAVVGGSSTAQPCAEQCTKLGNTVYFCFRTSKYRTFPNFRESNMNFPVLENTSWTCTGLCSGEFNKFSLSTTSFTLSMHLNLTMHYFCCYF